MVNKIAYAKFRLLRKTIFFSLILCLMFNSEAVNIAAEESESISDEQNLSKIQEETGFLDFEDGKSYNTSDTIEVYNERTAYSAIGDGVNGGKSLKVSVAQPADNQSDKISYGVTRIAYDKLPDDKDYYISWDFYLKGGGDIFLNQYAFSGEDGTAAESVGVIGICESGLVSAKKGWTKPQENDGTTIKVSDITNTWHSLEGVRSHSDDKISWYLDGVKFSEIAYSAVGEFGYMYIQTYQNDGAIGDELAEFDNFACGVCGAFSAEAEVKDSEASVRFGRYPNTLPNKSDISLKDGSGETTAVTKVERTGKSLKLTLEKSVTPGKNYTLTFGNGGVKDNLNNAVTTVYTAAKATEYSFTAEPSQTGGIYDDTEDVRYKVTVKKPTLKKMTFDVSAKAYNKDKTVVWQDMSAVTAPIMRSETSFYISPQIYDNSKRYGLFELEISIKSQDDEAWQILTVPFAQIMKSSVLNYKMGVSTHYAERYKNTEDISGQLALNAKAGMGIDRDDVSWSSYESDPIHTLKGRLLQFYESSKAADMVPMGVMTHGIWKYDIGTTGNGRFAGIAKYENLYGATDEEIAEKNAKAELQMQYFSDYIQDFAAESAAYAYDGYDSVLDGNILEIGNEWDLGYYSQTYTDVDGTEKTYGVKPYVELLKTAWNAVADMPKRPKIVGIVSAVATKEQYLKIMGEYLDAGAAEYCDAISLHPYYWTESPEKYDICSLINETNKLFDDRGIERLPLILSEWGSSSALVHNKNRQKQAEQAVRGMALAGTMTDAVIWYTGQEKNYDTSVVEEKLGLVKSGTETDNGGINFAAKPVYAAIACYNSLTADTEQKMWTKDDNGTYTCEFANDNKKIIMFWNPEKSAEITFDKESGKTACVYDIYGNRTAKNIVFSSYTLTADSEPRYIVYTDSGSECTVDKIRFAAAFAGGETPTAAEVAESGSLAVDFCADSSDKPGVAVVAYYSDGRLTDIKTQIISSDRSGRQRQCVSCKTDSGGAAEINGIDEIKGFLWNTLNDMTPAYTSVSVN